MEMGICYGGVPTKIHNNTMGIRGYDFVEFYSGAGKMFAYWHAKAMGLDVVAYKGPETGHRDRMSILLSSAANPQFKIVITSPNISGEKIVTQTKPSAKKGWTFESSQNFSAIIIRIAPIPYTTNPKII